MKNAMLVDATCNTSRVSAELGRHTIVELESIIRGDGKGRIEEPDWHAV